MENLSLPTDTTSPSLRGLLGGTARGLAGGRVGTGQAEHQRARAPAQAGQTGGHGSEGVIHVLTTCFIGAQEAAGRRVAHGNQRAKGGFIRGAEQLSLRSTSREVERVPIASDEVLEMRFSLGALQAAPEFVEVVTQLDKERAIGQARTIVRRPAGAYRQAMTEVGEVGHDHKLASPRGLGSEDAELDEVKFCKLEGQQLGKLIFVKGEGSETIFGRRATVHLHNQKLSSVRLKVDAHIELRVHNRGWKLADIILHRKQGLEEKERTRAKSSGQDRKRINGH
eukprot:5687745-Pleurochrysis_carterae.AAC.1